ncbi:uncharacterized protein LOC119685863 [Teleopsis dalmanni]|uniref:uncharacterized protein LOC119685863 n=1 Tax=Teleopsis dalmanni TaxID=139649 RepID=UPI0018CEB6FC|nr:uncharacterized protein LOC119685863 [Teleopsis dalmanni]
MLHSLTLQKLAESICEVFTEELPETYYNKYCEGWHASGKLHDAYNNYRTRLAASGLITRRSKSTGRRVFREHKNNKISTDNVEDDILNLATEVNFDVALPLWQRTFEFRCNLLKTNISTSDFLQQFPVSAQSFGYKLFIEDTERMYGKPLNFDIPSNLLQSILSKLPRTKSPATLQILELIENENIGNVIN